MSTTRPILDRQNLRSLSRSLIEDASPSQGRSINSFPSCRAPCNARSDKCPRQVLRIKIHLRRNHNVILTPRSCHDAPKSRPGIRSICPNPLRGLSPTFRKNGEPGAPIHRLSGLEMENRIDPYSSREEPLLLALRDGLEILTDVHPQPEVSLISGRNCGRDRLG
jgi:hypothetical protein